MDLLFLSRLQFAVTIGFHYIYPPMNIGLGLILVIMEALWLRTGNDLYHRLSHFWVRIFGITFAMGVATGIVMEFQFGTNWSTYSRFVGDVFGSALAAEGIFAFFLESGFLGVLLFGWDRVSKRMHFFATLMVALGAVFSSIWIVVANSWQQTPAGYHLVPFNGGMRAEVTSFWAVVFNPSTVERLTHVLSGALQAGSTLVLSVSAWYLLHRRHTDVAKAALRIGIVVLAFGSLAQLFTGHQSGIEVGRYQPAKLAGLEAHFAADAPADMHLFGWVNEKERRVDFGIAVPGMLSWLVTGNPKAPLRGLDAFPPEDRPPTQIIFQTYHLMVVIGMALIGIALLGLFLWWRGRLYDARPLLWIFVFSVLGPAAANQLGWASAEIGRQPWVVYGLMRTSEGVSKVVAPGTALTSLILFTLIYILLLVLFLFLLDRKIRHGPEEEGEEIGEGRADA